jgi:hypothetical protein
MSVKDGPGDACDQARAAIAKTKGDVDGQRNGGK